ncbi:MAG: hypothetical protein ABIV06_15030, partial [Thermoanaerobaculia bacterium]
MSVRHLSPGLSRFTRFPSTSLIFAALGFGLSFGAPLSAQIVPLGGDIAVSLPDGDLESGANIAADRNGGWGVTWKSAHLDVFPDIGRQRRFDRDDHPVSGSLRDHDLPSADLGLDGGGKGVTAGVRQRPELGGAEVAAQCFDRLGATASAAVRVDTGAISQVSPYPGAVSIATASDGRSVVAWQEILRVPLALPSVYFRMLGADCAPEGEVISLGSVGTIGRSQPHVAVRGDGTIALVWIEGEQDSNLHVRAQLFDPDGAPLGSSSIAGPSGRLPSEPRVAVSASGLIAVVWKSDLQPPTSGSGTGIGARVLAADGTPTGDVLLLRSSRAANTAAPAV